MPLSDSEHPFPVFDPGDDLFQANLQVVRNRWPTLAPLLQKVPLFEECRLSDSPEPMLRIDGIHLGSGYDRLSEAALQASLVPADAPSAWLYGIGAGDLARELLKRDNIRKLQVVILNQAVLHASFRFFDHRDWLADARVNLLTALEAGDLQRPFAAVPSSLQLADDAAARLRDLVFLELSTPFIQEKHGLGNARIMARLEENFDHCLQDGDAASLFNRQKGEMVLVAGAGPTLADSFDWIHGQQQSGRPLIAVGSALKPLLAEKIVPDVVVVVDPGREEVLELFKGLDLSVLALTPLVYFPSVHRDVLSLWPGPLLTAYPEHPLYHDLTQKCPKQKLFSSGSVLHPAVDLAVGMGAAQVVLMGADFGFPDGYTHVAGATAGKPIEKTANDHWVHDGKGHRIPTAPNMRGFLRDLEGYIEKHPRVNFLNASRKGAFIRGTHFLETSK